METKTDQPPWIDAPIVHALRQDPVPWDPTLSALSPLCGRVFDRSRALWLSAELFRKEPAHRRCARCEALLNDPGADRAALVMSYLKQRNRAKVTATNSDVFTELDRIERAARLLVYLYAATLVGGGIAAIIAYLWAR